MSETPYRGPKIWSGKDVHMIFISVTFIEGTPLFKGKGQVFLVLKPGFNLHSGDTLALKTWLTTKKVDIVYTNDHDGSFHKLNYLTCIDILHLCEFNI